MQNKSYKLACNLCAKTIHAAELLLSSKSDKSTPLYQKLYLARSEANFYACNYMQAIANANLVLESYPQLMDAWTIKIRSLEKMEKHELLIKELKKVMIDNE